MSVAQRRPDRATGARHDEFWAWCDKGELRLQHCVNCGHLQWPIVNACEACADEALEWQRMSGRGTISSWCTFERDYYGGMLPIPWDTILVELEEGPLFLSNPKGFSWLDISIGIPVQLAFEACEDSGGPFNLPVFERA
jgi:uncharacterized protein